MQSFLKLLHTLSKLVGLLFPDKTNTVLHTLGFLLWQEQHFEI